ncbi:MAG: geranylgeranylglyceryl/heptaprenylglyceryl phosphate synthase [Candidatus Aenigmarchaeota archaeon]|nr:geranylgeranylglyceryl/heptaprenylglyceryl phosphate synthase [Candidatus Aenigmarchaeota archaeon]
MLKIGNVEENIQEKLKKDGALHFTLIDPNDQGQKRVNEIVKQAEAAGTDAFMVGGSMGAGYTDALDTMRTIKQATKLPVIVFPGNVDGVTKLADAVFFMSLLNSQNPYWITGAQAIGAAVVRRAGVEPIPMAYLVIYPGGTVSFIGDAKPIPREKPEIAAAYALAGEYLGMRLVYLEAGSGVKDPVPDMTVAAVRRATKNIIVVGGGIRDKKSAKNKVEAGADIIVTGTLVEENKDVGAKLAPIISEIKKAGKKRVKN